MAKHLVPHRAHETRHDSRHEPPPAPPPDEPRDRATLEATDGETVYPRWAHQVGGASQVVHSEAEALALGEGWSWAALPPAPVVTALEPATAEIGAAAFTLTVRGTGFLDGAVIVFATKDEPTTWVTPAEVTTGVDMSVWLAADTVTVAVRNPDDGLSNALDFVFTEPPASREGRSHGHSRHATHEGD